MDSGIKKIKLPHTTDDNDWSYIKEQIEIIKNKVQFFFSEEDGNEGNVDLRAENKRGSEQGSERCSERDSGEGREGGDEGKIGSGTNKLILKAVRTLNSLAQELYVLPQNDFIPTVESDIVNRSSYGPGNFSGMNTPRFVYVFFLFFLRLYYFFFLFLLLHFSSFSLLFLSIFLFLFFFFPPSSSFPFLFSFPFLILFLFLFLFKLKRRAHLYILCNIVTRKLIF